MKDKIIEYTPATHGKWWLPQEPFPYPFENEGLKPVLRDFLKVLRRHPAYAETTHDAFYRLVAREGLDLARMEDVKVFTGLNIPAFRAVSEDFFGMELPIYKIVTGYGSQAADGGRARKKALAITGSPGSAKSALVNKFQKEIMHHREPTPYLAGSPMLGNPLNALFLPKLIAEKASDNRQQLMLECLTQIVTDLDFSGESELDYSSPKVAGIVQKHGFQPNTRLSPEDLAKIILKSERDFVAMVCYGLGLEQDVLESLGMPDPCSQEMVLGEFFGPARVKAKLLKAAGINPKENHSKGKGKNDPNYGEFDSEWAIPLWQFPISNFFMSRGEGIVDVSELQPINFDIDVFRGSKNIGAIGVYDDRDPRSVNWTGVFIQGKFVIQTEGFRHPDEAFRVFLELLEGQRLQLADPISSFHQEGVHWEGMIWFHSNDEQWNAFYSNPAHRAHEDRIEWVNVQYPIEPKMSSKVSDKLYSSSKLGVPVRDGGVHREPILSELFGLFRVATHLDWKSKDGLPFMAVLNAYNGLAVRAAGMTEDLNVRVLIKKAALSEGLTGMSPRNFDTLLGQYASFSRQDFEVGNRKSPCFTAKEFADYLVNTWEKDPRISKDVRELWTGWLTGPLEREFRRVELSKIYKAAFIPGFKGSCQMFFDKYYEYLRAIASPKQKQTNDWKGDYINRQAMETFMQTIERSDQLSTNSAQSTTFRLSVLTAIDAYKDEYKGQNVPYTVHPGLKRCIESYVLRQGQDITGIIGLSNLSPDEEKRLNDAKQRLIDDFGYCSHCSGKLVIEVASSRDFLVA